VSQGYGKTLQEMYVQWPFFQSTMDLIEMILAKADMRIAQVYDEVRPDEIQSHHPPKTPCFKPKPPSSDALPTAWRIRCWCRVTSTRTWGRT
jgi:hypothetical protein